MPISVVAVTVTDFDTEFVGEMRTPRVIYAFVLSDDGTTITWTRKRSARYSARSVRVVDRGVTWAPGWDTKAAHALRVMAALTQPA
ncbi:MAG TPA: hypothetical protein VGY48_15410 [Vicinamibacterales bacterium]|jgi:hypothetical protein|nr:hypothetical protein [Vicinamibacterales bacterium]